MSPGREELEEGIPFVGSSGRVLAAACSRAGLRFDNAFCVNTVNCYPMGTGETLTTAQRTACASRLAGDLANCEARVLVPLGGDALLAITGFKGVGHGISAWRGYVVLPGETKGIALPPSVRAIVPAYHPAYIIRRGLTEFPWLVADIRRAVELSRAKEIVRWTPPAYAAPAELRNEPLGVDIETGGGRITRIGCAGLRGALSCEPPFPALAPLLAAPTLKIIHNASFDVPHLEAAGFTVGGELWDTLAAQQVIDPDAPGFSLNETASFHLTMARWKHIPGGYSKPLKVRTWKKDFVCAGCEWRGTEGSGTGKGRVCVSCTDIENEKAHTAWARAHAYYNLEDAAVLPPIFARQHAALVRRGQLDLFKHMMKVTREVLIPIQQRGLRIDARARDDARSALATKLELAFSTWKELAGDVNASSVIQLRKLLYEEWGLPVQKTRDGKWSTDAEALENLLADEGALDEDQRRAVLALRDIRRSTKWIETYTKIGDRIWPAYGPVGKDSGGRLIAATGRILAKGAINPDGTKSPPLQQIPDELRNIVIPEEGMLFVGADYSSQELRIVAAKAGCHLLLRQLAEGVDIHGDNCARFGCDRTRAKNIFYAWVFGGSARAAQRALRLQGFAMKEEQIRTYFGILAQRYPEIPRYHSRLIALVARDGFMVNSFGRRRDLKDTKHSYNEILNFPIQSDGADIGWTIVPATDKLAREYGGFLSILLHDGFYWQIPAINVGAFIPKLRLCLEREWPMIAPGFRIPVDIKVGENWRDLVAVAA